MVTRHGVHKAELYPVQAEVETNLSGVEGEDKSAIYEVVCDEWKIKRPSAFQAILSNTVNLCDREGICRPTYIIEDLIW